MWQRALSGGGGGDSVELFLGNQANNGNVSWGYNAKIVIASIINSYYNHIVIYDLSQSNYKIWFLRNGANSDNWTFHDNPASVGFGYIATAKSISMSIPSGYKCNMIVPLNTDFPTSITP